MSRRWKNEGVLKRPTAGNDTPTLLHLCLPVREGPPPRILGSCLALVGILYKSWTMDGAVPVHVRPMVVRYRLPSGERLVVLVLERLDGQRSVGRSLCHVLAPGPYAWHDALGMFSVVACVADTHTVEGIIMAMNPTHMVDKEPPGLSAPGASALSHLPWPLAP